MASYERQGTVLETKVTIENVPNKNKRPQIDEVQLAAASREEMIDIIQAHDAAMEAYLNEILERMANYEETIGYLSRKLYGRSKEDPVFPGQLSIFNEAEEEAETASDENDPELESLLEDRKGKKKSKKRRGTHDDLFGSIPEEKVLLRLKGDNRKCEWCGNEMEVLGEKYVREELHIVPAKLTRIKIYQEVLICKHCKQEADEAVIAAPAAPEPLIPNSYVSPSTIAWIITEKYMKHVPLYRLEQQLKQDGIKLHRGTMAKWLINVVGLYIEPLYQRMIGEQLKRELLHADETPCQVLKEPGRKATQRSYIWLYTSGNDGLPPILIYDYHPSRAHTIPADYLKDWHGYLHTDCYDGYNALEAHLIRCACWAHLRRYWYDAIPSELQRSAEKGTIDKEKIGPSVRGFLYCEKLFELERKYKDLSPEDRFEKRKEKELPIIDRFFEWVKTLDPLGGSKLAMAVTYTLNNEDTLRNYLKDGRVNISNNRAERAAKTYVMGRKAFLFHDTVAGANASAILYSLVETARANNLNVYQYIYFTLRALSGYKKQLGNIDQYLPWTDYIQGKCHISVIGTNEEEEYD